MAFCAIIHSHILEQYYWYENIFTVYIVIKHWQATEQCISTIKIIIGISGDSIYWAFPLWPQGAEHSMHIFLFPSLYNPRR